jgi:uncharacterized protein (TIGR03435 family)
MPEFQPPIDRGRWNIIMSMTRLCRRAALLGALVWPALTQVAGPRSRFEVASIKVSGPGGVRGSDGGPGSKDPGRFTYGKAELLSLILYAYNVNTFQVQSRIPLDRDAFDLVAKVPEGATKEDLRAMLQNLLTDRFNLKARVEKREFDSAVLVVAPGGLKMAPSGLKGTPVPTGRTSACEFPVFPASRPGYVSKFTLVHGVTVACAVARQQSVANLADMLHQFNDMPVVDGTGMADKFDFTLEYSVGLSASSDAEPGDAADLSRALKQQLGLQIVRRKTPFDFVVVESVDRLPTEN